MGSRQEAKSSEIRKKIEKHRFEDEEGEEYEPSKFGGFNDYFRRKKIKLQNLDAELRALAQQNPPVFKGVVAHVNGYTQPSLNDLHNLIVSHSGGFLQYLDGKTMVTHIIASNLTPKKKIEFSKYRIVKPAWVVDSIDAGRLLPWDSYRIVDEGPGQRVLGFDRGGIVSQRNDKQNGYRDQTDTSWYTSQIKDVARQVNDGQKGWFPTSVTRHISDTTTTARAQSESAKVDCRSLGIEEDGPTRIDEKDDSPGSSDSENEEARANYEQTVRENLRYRSDSEASLAPDQPLTKAPGKSPERSPKSIASSPKMPHMSKESAGEGGQDPGDLANADSSEEKARANPDADLSPMELGQGDSSALTAVESLTPEESRGLLNVQDMTPEEHNALLLADPKVRKSTVVNPGFLKQYYEESRLHHLSTWKAALKSQLQALAFEKTSSQKAREKRAPGTRRYVLHVDFDSFFATVSLQKCPQYVDKPVVVAHGNGSGAEIASCNYPARKYGIKNGMWMKHAQKMCSDLKVLPYDFRAYEDASRKFYDAVIGTGGLVQSISVDEALVDISTQCIAAGGHEGKGIHEGSIWREQAKADTIAQQIRDDVKEKTGCAVSVGIGGNILLAKVALRKAKPAGQYQINPEEVLDFLGDLTVQDLPGVAHSIGGKLEEIGVKYVKDVRQLSKERMVSVLGPKTGEKIWDYSRGIDKSEVGDQVVRKSVSAEVNWGIRFVTQEQVDEFIFCLTEELHKRLVNEGVKGRQLTMKIMRRAADAPLDPPKHLGHGKCDIFNKSSVLGVSTNDPALLGREALSILKGFGFSPGELRGLGIQMQKLEQLKMNAQGPLESSQRKLQFKAPISQQSSFLSEDAPAENIKSPQKPNNPHSPHQAVSLALPVSTSEKPSVPLNTFGTQFVLPSQVDPAVLKELPADMHSRLFPNGISGDTNGAVEPHASTADADEEITKRIDAREDSRSRYTMLSIPVMALPSHSQIDKEALDALPAEVRTEVLAYYARSPHKARRQAVLPQSPRKDRAIRLPKKLTTPTKRRGRPIGGGGFKAAASASSTLTQSNFVANLQAATSKDSLASVSDGFASGDISPEFLSALPEDIRDEVIAQARRERLQKKSGLDVPAQKKRPAPRKELPRGQRTLNLPLRPPKPTFTANAYTTLPELRDAMLAWHDEFKSEPPYEEDIKALVKYLRRVVLDEGDMDKAVSLVKWLKWLIERDGDNGKSWDEGIKRVEQGVQGAVQERGLGRVEF